MAHANPLGRIFDIGLGVAPLDLQTARTGLRQSMINCDGVLIVIIKGAGTDGDDQTFTLNEHTAASGGTSQVLAQISEYFEKEETTLDNDEAWVRVTQTAASTLAPGDPSAQVQAIYAIPIWGDQLSDSYKYISLDNDGAGANAQLGTIIYIPFGLSYPNIPANQIANL